AAAVREARVAGAEHADHVRARGLRVREAARTAAGAAVRGRVEGCLAAVRSVVVAVAEARRAGELAGAGGAGHGGRVRAPAGRPAGAAVGGVALDRRLAPVQRV